MGGVCDTCLDLYGELVIRNGFFYLLEQRVIQEQASREVVELVRL